MARLPLSVIGIIVITAVLIASAGGYIFNTGTTGKNQTDTSSFQSNISTLQQRLQTLQAQEGCLAAVPVPQRPTGNLTPVLLMKANSTGIICVTYRTSWGGNASLYTNYASSLANRSQYLFGVWITRNNSLSHSFKVSAQPNPVTPSPTLSSITVLYQVTALANSTGFYDQSAPYGYCNAMPMAVGYTANQVNNSDFPPRPPVHSCPAEAYIPAAVGIEGMTFTLVDIPASHSYMTAPSGGSFCSETASYYAGNAPCFTYNESQAYTFNCTAEAATSSGCAVTMGTGSSAFNVTVWYPAKNQSMPWANCYYVVSNTSGKTPAAWDVCIAVTPNSFVVATPPGPLT